MYNYNNIDNFLQTNRMKTAYFDEEMAANLYNDIQNFVIVNDQVTATEIDFVTKTSGEIWDAVKDVGSSLGKGIGKGVGGLAQKGYNTTKNLIQNQGDKEVPTTSRELTKVTDQQFIDYLKQRNNYYPTDDINAIYNFIANYPDTKGAIYNIPKEEFIAGITKACPYKNEWEDKIRNYFSNENLNKIDKNMAKVLNSFRLQSYTDAVKKGLFDIIRKEIPQFGKEFSTAEVRMGFLKAQQDAQQQAIKNSPLQQDKQQEEQVGLAENEQEQPIDETQKEETLQHIYNFATKDLNKYHEYSDQYNIFITEILQNSEKRIKNLNSLINEVVEKNFEGIKDKLEKEEIILENHEQFNALIAKFFNSAFNETVDEAFDKSFEEIFSRITKREGDLESKKRKKVIKETTEAINTNNILLKSDPNRYKDLNKKNEKLELEKNKAIESSRISNKEKARFKETITQGIQYLIYNKMREFLNI